MNYYESFDTIRSRLPARLFHRVSSVRYEDPIEIYSHCNPSGLLVAFWQVHDSKLGVSGGKWVLASREQATCQARDDVDFDHFKLVAFVR